jgi:hypothetical protein
MKVKRCAAHGCTRLTLADRCDQHREPPIEQQIQQWIEAKRIRDEERMREPIMTEGKQ